MKIVEFANATWTRKISKKQIAKPTESIQRHPYGFLQ